MLVVGFWLWVDFSLRKENWEVAMYPVEGHGFRRADSRADEYKRILKLFETHLKK